MPDETNPPTETVVTDEITTNTTQPLDAGAAETVETPPQTAAVPEAPPEAPAVRLNITEMIAHYKANGTPQQKGFFETLEGYSLQMRPMYPAVPDQQLLHQRQLFAAFLDLFGSYYGNDFGDYWKCVIAYGKNLAKEHGTFSKDNYLRQSYKLYSDEKTFSQHKALVHLFVTVLNSGKKGIAETVVMAKVEELGFEPNVMRGIHRAYL